MTESHVSVVVCGSDSVLELGIATQFRGRREVRLLDGLDIDSADVAVAVTHDVGGPTLSLLRAIQRDGCPRVVLIAGRFDDGDVLAAVEAGAFSLLRTSEVTPERLVETVLAAAVGRSSLPPDLLGCLLERFGSVRGRDHIERPPCLSDREIEVLRLVADGHDTAAIARMLHYSERTIKGVLHGITSRLQLRNRTHAVAFALRQDLL